MKKYYLKQTLTVSIFFFLSLLTVKATVYTDDGTSTTYHLYSGDILQIRSGTFSGSILTFESGASIKVLTGSTFKPEIIIRPRGSIINIGTSILSFSSNETTPLDGFTLDNFGIVRFTGRTNTNGNEVWLNRFGATIQFDGEVQLNPGVHFTNNGTIQSNGNLFINGNTYFLNNNMVDAKLNIAFHGGVTVNKGTIQAKGNILYPLGTDHTNSCRIITEGNFETYNTFINDGFIWVKGSGSNRTFTNYGYGALILRPNSIIKTTDFINYSTISGTGSLYFTGNSYNIGGTVGSTSGSESIKVYETTRVNPTGTFDFNWGGTIHSNVTFDVIPDPGESYMPTGCADLTSSIPLPLKWNFFQVKVEQQTPVLSWKTTFDNLSHFIVERSTDQQTFHPISTFTAEENKVYTYTDHSAKTFTTVYYRIKAIEPTGKVQYSEIRKVELKSNNIYSLNLSPNPTLETAFLNLHQEKKQKLQLITRNASGQTIAIQESISNAGQNRIELSIVRQLPKGVYLIEVRTPDSVLGTIKFIKQ